MGILGGFFWGSNGNLNGYLVGGFNLPTPLKNDGVKVNGKDDIPDMNRYDGT